MKTVDHSEPAQTLSVLVPYRPDGGWRDESWAWIRQRWEILLPEVELIVCDDGGDPSQNPGHFNHPLAINTAAKLATRDVFCIADADTAFGADWITDAVQLVHEGAAWVLPSFYDKLTQRATKQVRWAPPVVSLDRYAREWRGDCVSWSGMVVVSREGFETVGGYDERFSKWGADDMCFGLSMDTLWGRHTRLPGSCYHLWHPAPLQHTYGHDRQQEQYYLGERYRSAANRPNAMRRVRFGG